MHFHSVKALHFTLALIAWTLLSFFADTREALSKNGQSEKITAGSQPLASKTVLNGWKQSRKTSWLGDSISYVSKDGYIFSCPQMGFGTVCASGSSKVFKPPALGVDVIVIKIFRHERAALYQSDAGCRPHGAWLGGGLSDSSWAQQETHCQER